MSDKLTEAKEAGGGTVERRLQELSEGTVLLPLMIVSYMLQYLDKTTLGNAAIMGIIKDTHLVGQDYSWVSSIFYFGYLAASYPASVCFVKFPVGKFLSLSFISWAIVLTCHAATTNYAGLMVTRFLLGCFEATISPGFSLLTTLFYSREEHASRHAIWFAGNGIAVGLGNLAAYGILHIRHPLTPWQWLFIIFGLVTFLWGVCLLYGLPDAPSKARFLNERQRQIVVRRSQQAHKIGPTQKYKMSEVWEALSDPKTWLLFFFTVTMTIPNGGLTNFSSLIISGFGFSLFTTLLMGLPSAGFQILYVMGSSYLATKIRQSRCVIMAILCIISIVGCVVVRQLPQSNKTGRLMGLYLFGAYAATFPLSLSLIASNTQGFTKKTLVTAIMLVGYCTGNIAGPHLFYMHQAPRYESAFTGILVCFCLGWGLVVALRLVMSYENRRRDRLYGVVDSTEAAQDASSDEQQWEALTDFQNKKLRYCL